MKINYYMIISFILIAVIMLLLVNQEDKRQSNIYNFDGLEIEKEKFNILSEAVNSQDLLLCNIPNNQCVTIQKF